MESLKKISLEIASKISNSGLSSLEDILTEIRYSLQFTTTPTRDSMKNGFVDCVGAAVIAQRVFSKFYPEENFKVALTPKTPWNTGKYSDSKHCVVIRYTSEENYIQIIDPAPINGYGYGRVSKLFRRRQWGKNDEGNYFVLNPSSMDWNDYLYPSFIPINDDEILRILSVSQMKADLVSNLKFDILGAPNSLGWKKDYFRILSKKSLSIGNTTQALNFMEKTLESCLNNPYVLNEYINLLKQLKDNTIEKFVVLKNKAVKAIIRYNNRACKKWQSDISNAKAKKDWRLYLYCVGCIFWRKQSNDILSNKTSSNVLTITFKGKKIPLYELLPRWFELNNVQVSITQEKPNNAICSFRYIIDEVNLVAIDFYKLQVVNQDGWISIFENKSNVEKHSFYGREAYKYLFSLVAPELLIV